MAAQTQSSASFGVVGLGVMGSMLALNLAEKTGESIAGFELDPAKAEAAEAKATKEGLGSAFKAYTDLKEPNVELKRSSENFEVAKRCSIDSNASHIVARDRLTKHKRAPTQPGCWWRASFELMPAKPVAAVRRPSRLRRKS